MTIFFGKANKYAILNGRISKNNELITGAQLSGKPLLGPHTVRPLRCAQVEYDATLAHIATVIFSFFSTSAPLQ